MHCVIISNVSSRAVIAFDDAQVKKSISFVLKTLAEYAEVVPSRKKAGRINFGLCDISKELFSWNCCL